MLAFLARPCATAWILLAQPGSFHRIGQSARCQRRSVRPGRDEKTSLDASQPQVTDHQLSAPPPAVASGDLARPLGRLGPACGPLPTNAGGVLSPGGGTTFKRYRTTTSWGCNRVVHRILVKSVKSTQRAHAQEVITRRTGPRIPTAGVDNLPKGANSAISWGSLSPVWPARCLKATSGGLAV